MSRNSAGSSNQSHFANTPSVKLRRSTFDRSFTHKTTFDSGHIIPFFVDEILPGDTMKVSTNILARLTTPLFPYMDNLYLDVHFFFVPTRLVWENWERFNGAQDNPEDSTDFLVPQLDASLVTSLPKWPVGGLEDYFGIPTNIDGSSWTQEEMPNALPFRAYNLIWNEWYRDQNLMNSVPVPKGDGPDDPADYILLDRCRRKDYFTSALPWPQKGPSVLIPMGPSDQLPVIFPDGIGIEANGQDIQFKGGVSGALGRMYKNGSNVLSMGDGLASSGAQFLQFGTEPGLVLNEEDVESGYVELIAGTINQLREAFQIQRLFERDARGGTRYTEILLSHFGVQSPDFRLQRPEFLGGGTININVNPVANTTGTEDAPQGNLAAFATGVGSKGFNHSFTEHGYVLGLISVRADTTYQQGMHKMWSRRTRFDFYWPTLAHLGEQVILNKEIYFTGTSWDNEVFGYQERFAEYRYKPSMVTGKFRSNDSASLDTWHLAIDFDGQTPLAELQNVILETPPVKRLLAVQNEPEFMMDTYTSIKHTRAMPTYSIPGLVDHF